MTSTLPPPFPAAMTNRFAALTYDPSNSSMSEVSLLPPTSKNTPNRRKNSSADPKSTSDDTPEGERKGQTTNKNKNKQPPASSTSASTSTAASPYAPEPNHSDSFRSLSTNKRIRPGSLLLTSLGRNLMGKLTSSRALILSFTHKSPINTSKGIPRNAGLQHQMGRNFIRSVILTAEAASQPTQSFTRPHSGAPAIIPAVDTTAAIKILSNDTTADSTGTRPTARSRCLVTYPNHERFTDAMDFFSDRRDLFTVETYRPLTMCGKIQRLSRSNWDGSPYTMDSLISQLTSTLTERGIPDNAFIVAPIYRENLFTGDVEFAISTEYVNTLTDITFPSHHRHGAILKKYLRPECPLCTYCVQTGHTASDCPGKLEGLHRRCVYCGSIDHSTNECTQRSHPCLICQQSSHNTYNCRSVRAPLEPIQNHEPSARTSSRYDHDAASSVSFNDHVSLRSFSSTHSPTPSYSSRTSSAPSETSEAADTSIARGILKHPHTPRHQRTSTPQQDLRGSSSPASSTPSYASVLVREGQAAASAVSTPSPHGNKRTKLTIHTSTARPLANITNLPYQDPPSASSSGSVHSSRSNVSTSTPSSPNRHTELENQVRLLQQQHNEQQQQYNKQQQQHNEEMSLLKTQLAHIHQLLNLFAPQLHALSQSSATSSHTTSNSPQSTALALPPASTVNDTTQKCLPSTNPPSNA